MNKDDIYWLIGQITDLLAAVLERLEETEDPEPTPDPEPVPPIEPIPPPSSPSYLGIGYNDLGHTMFPPPRLVATLAADGSGDFASLHSLNQALINGAPIDEVHVRGQFDCDTQLRVGGSSKERPLVFRGEGPQSQLNNMWSDQVVNHLAFCELRMANPRFYQAGQDLLFERVRLIFGADGLVVQGGYPAGPGMPEWVNFAVRLSAIRNNYRSSSKAQGVFLAGVKDPVFEYCLFDQNGWAGARSDLLPSPADQLRSHHIYAAQPSGPARVKGCLFSRSASHGAFLRAGGLLEECIFIRCPIAWQYGYHYPSDGGSSGYDYGPVSGTVRGNIAIGSDDVAGGNDRGMFGILEYADGVTVEDNLVVLNTSATMANNLFLTFTKNGPPCQNVVSRNNRAYRWGYAYRNPPPGMIEEGNQLDLGSVADEPGLLSLMDEAIAQVQRGFGSVKEAQDYYQTVRSMI